jgi:hypothetical protein
MGGRNEKTFPPIRNTERSVGRPVSRLALIIPFLTLLMAPCALNAQQITLGGVGTRTRPLPSRTANGPRPAAAQGNANVMFNFGTVNALGINPNTGGANVTLSVEVLSTGNPATSGALYFFTQTLTVTLNGSNDRFQIRGFINSPFSNGQALILENCPTNNVCNSVATASTNYSPYSLNSASPSIVEPTFTGNQNVTVGFGLFVPDNDGANAFTGSDGVTLTLNLFDVTTNQNSGNPLLVAFSVPNIENALQFSLGGSSLIQPNGTNFTLNFGNVNGLGIGPQAGLTALTPTANGAVYVLSYNVSTVFSDFRSLTSTITVKLTSNFAHNTLLTLESAPATNPNTGGCPATPASYAPITGVATTITSTAADRSQTFHCLGLLVSRDNVPAVFLGTDNASLTYTMTVP